MYEPVSAGNVTVANNQSNQHMMGTPQLSDADDDAASPPDDRRTGTTNNIEQLNNNESPRRPPRRKKRSTSDAATITLKTNKIRDSMRTGNGDRCIDIDHITLEHNNFKNKRQTIATQTCQVVPYRLKFWPRTSALVKCTGDAKPVEHVICCCRVLSQWLLSQVGLTVILVCWATLGAFAFYQTEGPREQQQAEELKKLQDELTVDLSTDLVTTDKDGWPRMVKKYILKHEQLLLEAVSAGFGEGGGGSIWTYPGCILFAVSLLTTLGFGAPVPRTPLGRGAAILFSAVGIPLHFLLILNIGTLTAGILYNLATRESRTEIPNISTGTTKTALWLKWLPVISILFYYVLGVILFGYVRSRGFVDSLMFPLDFTAAGGVAKTSGVVRVLYALYLEFAVTLAAIIVSLVQVTATRGFIDLGLRLGLLTNT